VLTFFIAGLLFSLVPQSTSITRERTPHPVRRPDFSSHLVSPFVGQWGFSENRTFVQS
jgi:hypothetical protein